MNYEDNQYIRGVDISFVGILNDIKRSKTALQPIFEAFTNAIEAIKIKAKTARNYTGKIDLQINATENTLQTTDFHSLTITDNGVGFNDVEFTRFNTFKDSTKGYKNIGSGRIQYSHFFDNTVVKSVFNENGQCFEREFIFSKKKLFLQNNSIVFHRQCKSATNQESCTSITFNTLLENSNVYDGLNEKELKNQLMKRYIHYFCHNKSDLPIITIKFFVQSILKGETTISAGDIPNIDKTESIHLPYSKIASDAKSIEKTNKTEEFKIDAFKISSDILELNDLKLVSKGEIVEESDVSLQSLAKGEDVKGYKYLFLVASNYIDLRDTNIRGELKIPNRDAFSKSPNLFTDAEILLEDIQEGVNSKINLMYPEIEEVKHKHDVRMETLKEMFFLDEETTKGVNISINDSESKILEKFYEAEAKKTASIDATIKESIDHLHQLNPTDPNYNDDLKKEIDKLSELSLHRTEGL